MANGEIVACCEMPFWDYASVWSEQGFEMLMVANGNEIRPLDFCLGRKENRFCTGAIVAWMAERCE